MALRSMTVDRYEEIQRRLAAGRSLREIAHALGCSRRTVREVRDGCVFHAMVNSISTGW